MLAGDDSSGILKVLILLYEDIRIFCTSKLRLFLFEKQYHFGCFLKVFCNDFRDVFLSLLCCEMFVQYHQILLLLQSFPLLHITVTILHVHLLLHFVNFLLLFLVQTDMPHLHVLLCRLCVRKIIWHVLFRFLLFLKILLIFVHSLLFLRFWHNMCNGFLLVILLQMQFFSPFIKRISFVLNFFNWKVVLAERLI